MTAQRLFALMALLIWCPCPTPVAAEDFPPISAAERALHEAPGDPGATAIVLFKNAEFKMMDIARQEASSRLSVAMRIKVLKDEGTSRGEIKILHSDRVRLKNFKGRTVLPDGRVVPVADDARFRRKLSEAHGRFVTSVAFPAVSAGAILDYRYDLFFDSLYFLDPWYFSDDTPVAHSEIVYRIPGEIAVKPWGADPMNVGLHQERLRDQLGRKLRAWADNLPAVPAEPYGLPFNDAATQLMLLPLLYDDGVVHVPLLDSWASACSRIGEDYESARRKSDAATRKARQLAAASGTARQRAEQVFDYVRDAIVTDPLEGVALRKDSTVDGVLARASGDYADKALLLEAMLKAVRVDARLVWAGERSRGTIDLQVVNPAWFQRVLVAVDIDGRRVFLDPSDRALGFGQLPQELEGTAALIPDPKKPEQLVLPETAFERNERHATLELGLDRRGRMSGNGDLLLTGHHARRGMDLASEPKERTQDWQKWLAEMYPDFKIDQVRVAESPEAEQVRVIWAMAQREETVLGDESSLVPSRPLGPLRQPFAVPAARRLSPVLFEFPERDVVEVRLHWEPGWKLDALPAAARRESDGVAFLAAVKEDAAQRTLSYQRTLERRGRKVEGRAGYEKLQALFEEVEKNDARTVVLVRR